MAEGLRHSDIYLTIIEMLMILAMRSEASADSAAAVARQVSLSAVRIVSTIEEPLIVRLSFRPVTSD